MASILTTGTALIPRARPPVLSHPLYHQKRPPTSRNRAFELAPAAVRRDCTPRAYFAAPLSSVIFCHEFFLPLLFFSPHPRGKKRRRIRTVYLFSAEYIFTCPYETFKIYLVVILLFRYILYHTWKTIVSHPLVYNVSDLCASPVYRKFEIKRASLLVYCFYGRYLLSDSVFYHSLLQHTVRYRNITSSSSNSVLDRRRARALPRLVRLVSILFDLFIIYDLVEHQGGEFVSIRK